MCVRERERIERERIERERIERERERERELREREREKFVAVGGRCGCTERYGDN